MFFKTKETIPKSYLNGKRIGVIGLAPRCGTTHIAVAISNYLSEEEKKRVYLLEQNRHNDLKYLNKKLGAKEPEKPFTFHRVTYIPSYLGKGIDDIPDIEGDCIVFDYGCDFKINLHPLLLCDIKIIVGTDAVWRMNEYEKLYDLSANHNLGANSFSWKLFVNLGNTKKMKEKDIFGLTICCFPFEPEPVYPSRETVLFLKEAIFR